MPGGSSGGSASAVAARSALMATGTDTGGSIRQPPLLRRSWAQAHMVAVRVGGIVAFASSLDQAGPFARTVADNALMLQAMTIMTPRTQHQATYRCRMSWLSQARRERHENWRAK